MANEGESHSKVGRIALRVFILVIICVIAFYVGRPLYWKITASIHEVREKNYKQVSQLVQSAQKTVGGWIHDDSDSGVIEQPIKNQKKSDSRKVKSN